jgi:hypothetical protein
VLRAAPIEDPDGQQYTENIAFVETRDLYEWAFIPSGSRRLLEKGKNVGRYRAAVDG